MLKAQRKSEGQPPIDSEPPRVALATMLASHLAAAETVRAAGAEIETAARLFADTIAAGGTVLYAAAGSSGLMAVADACELPGTFGVPEAQIRIAMAGGIPTDARMPGDTEDDTDATRAVAGLGPGDLAIVLSASGTTPFALAVASAARERGLRIIGIANVAGSALLRDADVAIALPTAAEVVEGSTRLGAGTAQKIALNMISTLAGVLLGHVHDGLMVNLRADNAKLRRRAAGIVARIAGVELAAAEAALAAAGHDTKSAVLVALGASADEARARLATAKGRLATALTTTIQQGRKT